MLLEFASQCGADDVYFCSVVEEEFVWFIFDENGGVFEV